MVNLILFFIMFIIILYIVFQLFVQLFKSFHLIDNFFVNKIDNVEDFFVKKLIDTDDINNDILNEIKNSKRKTLNMYLRFDFLISLILGIFWFIFPIFVLDVKLKSKGKYLGKYLGLFTLISCYLPLFNIKDKDLADKKKILITKFIITWIVIITFFIHVYYLNRINPYAVFSLFLTTIWMSNSFLGIYDGYDLDKKNLNKILDT